MEPNDKGVKEICRVCQGIAAGVYFGALVCLPCKVGVKPSIWSIPDPDVK